MWHDEYDPNNRQLSKQQCLDMDWNNVKEITAWELALCIAKYDLDTDRIPEARLQAVTKELVKLQKQEQERQVRHDINTVLAIFAPLDEDAKFSGPSDEVIDHYFDPALFHTVEEAITAVSELNSICNQELTKTEECNHTYKNTDTHSRDIERLKEAMTNVRNRYIKLGGIPGDFDRHVSQVPLPTKGTLNQDIHAQRESIKEQFISIGTPPTRAEAIAKAITTEALWALK